MTPLSAGPRRHYCTLFDINYLGRGLALIASLERHGAPFTLHVLCLDEATHDYFSTRPSPSIRPIPLARLEEGDAALREARGNRSRIEYYFTLTPTLPLRVLEWNPEIEGITYLDADLYFFSSPEAIFDEMGDRSILIIGHRFPEHLRDRECCGLYNVGFLSFRRDRNGLACLEWWRARCNEWCYDRVEPGRFADQKYLDCWPEKFPGVCVLGQAGAGLAPWNLFRHRITGETGALRVDGAPLVFHHFHHFTLRAPRIVRPGTGMYWTHAAMPAPVRDGIFLPYFLELRRLLREEPEVREPALSRYQARPGSFLSELFLGEPKLLYVAGRLHAFPAFLNQSFWTKRLGRRLRKGRNWLLAPFKRLLRRGAALPVVLALLAGTVSGRAQETPVPTPPAGNESTEAPPAPNDDAIRRRLEFLTKKLGLTAAQQSQVGQILREEIRVMPNFFNNQSLLQDRKGAGRIRTQARERISAALTPPQREVYAQMHPGQHWLP